MKNFSKLIKREYFSTTFNSTLKLYVHLKLKLKHTYEIDKENLFSPNTRELEIERVKEKNYFNFLMSKKMRSREQS